MGLLKKQISNQLIQDELRSQYKITDSRSDFEMFSAKYSNIEQLAHGGMGTVFKVQDKEQHITRVVKRLNMSIVFSHHDAFQQATLLEAMRTIGNHSPNIVRIVDRIYFWDKYFQIVMEFAQGEDLREFVHTFNSRCVSKRASKQIMEQGIDIMWRMWQLDLFHRDVKGNNFVVADQDQFPDSKEALDANSCLDIRIFIKLIDFDFIDVVHRKGNPHKTFMGTPGYMSPQIQNQQIQEKTDIYSLGMMQQQLLTGIHMFSGKEQEQAMNHHKEQDELRSKNFNSFFWTVKNTIYNLDAEKTLITQMTNWKETDRISYSGLRNNKQFDFGNHQIFKNMQTETVRNITIVPITKKQIEDNDKDNQDDF